MPGFLIRLLNRLFGSRETTGPENLHSPVRVTSNGDNTTLDVSVYQTNSLTEDRGRAPEQSVVRFIEKALEDADYNCIIKFNFEPVSNQYDEATTEALRSWSAEIKEDNEAGINIVLGNRYGGGISYLGGRYSLAPGAEIRDIVEFVENCPSRPCRNIRANIHEVGHDLGAVHADNIVEAPYMLFTEQAKPAFDSPPPKT